MTKHAHEMFTPRFMFREDDVTWNCVIVSSSPQRNYTLGTHSTSGGGETDVVDLNIWWAHVLDANKDVSWFPMK